MTDIKLSHVEATSNSRRWTPEGSNVLTWCKPQLTTTTKPSEFNTLK